MNHVHIHSDDAHLVFTNVLAPFRLIGAVVVATTTTTTSLVTSFVVCFFFCLSRSCLAFVTIHSCIFNTNRETHTFMTKTSERTHIHLVSPTHGYAY